jgi:UDP-glucose:(heptosyl)LPS alpha-1,3-glucosyltransferase
VHLAYELLNGKKIPKDHEVAQIHEKILTEQKFKRLVCNSKMMREDLCKRFSISKDKVEVIYPEYNPEKFNLENSDINKAQMRQNLGLKDEVVIGLITSGNFKKRNVILLLKAIALLSDKTNLKVIIAGKDKDDAYREFIVENNLAEVVSFHPSINEVEKYYHAIDIFVLPALIEEFGRSVLEAMACGKPVIVSSTVGSSEILEGESKEYILHQLTSLELTQKLVTLIESKDLRDSTGALNIDTALKYTSEKQNEKFENLLKGLGYEFKIS